MAASITSKPKLLILSLVYPPDNYSGAARPHRFARYLPEFGYPVEVVAGTLARQVTSENSVHRLPAQFDTVPKDSFLEKVFRKTLFPHDEGVIWSWAAASYAGRWRGERIVLLSTSPPLTTHLAAMALQQRYGWPWIADFRDPLAGNPYRMPRVRHWDRMVQNMIFRRASALIANTDSVAAKWSAEYPARSGKIHQIWNGFDPADPLGPAPIPPRKRRILRHVGAVYGDRYPDMLLASVQRLIAGRRCDPETFCIELVGPIGETVEAMPKEEWFHCVPQQVSKSEANRLITETDYLLLLDVTKSNTGLQVPAKIFDYVRIGRPILACTLRGSPVDRILSQSGVRYVGLYAGDPPQEIDRCLEQFLRMPTEPVAASEWFQKTFDGREQARALAAIIDQVAGS